MEDNIKYAIAMAEVLHYLKGIRQEDIDKIPQKLIEYFKQNSLESYVCKFDYKKPLKELELQEETKGLIAMICFNYWCQTAEQKEKFILELTNNEERYQKELREKYNPDNIFKKNKSVTDEIMENQKAMVEYKENIIIKILNKLKGFFKKY